MAEGKYVYRFDEGSAQMRDLLGGKGANLCEMTRLGLPVPPGFIISVEAFREYYRLERRAPEGLWEQVRQNAALIEQTAGRRFGDAGDPLLLSVRSGSKFSMPGMMDTVLNLGLNDATLEGLARATSDRRFALDSYRRFIQLFSKVVLHLPASQFEEALAQARKRHRVASDAELPEAALEDVVSEFKNIVQRLSSSPFPSDPWEQLQLAVQAVFDSWNSPRAVAYRRHHSIPDDLGTAATIMMMVFGNSGWDSGTGVCFSRDPNTGERALYGEYLPNAQGEDVVSGSRTPKPIAELAREMPPIYRQLEEIAGQLERHYTDVQDIEFTVERGKLYILQTRSAKRAGAAAVKTAVDMVDEGLIDRQEALRRVPPLDLSQLLLPRFEPRSRENAVREGRLLGRGLNASPGAATGRAIFEAEAVQETAEEGDTVILVRPETSAEDVPAILKAAAVLTSRGGITSHAAVVTRGLGKPAVVGCARLHVDLPRRRMSVNSKTIREGDEISIDGFTGEVFAGHIETMTPSISGDVYLERLLAWADDFRRLRVRANADTMEEALQALAFGAEGIGLCRTEHMFFDPDRLPYVRQVLLYAREAAQLEREALDAQEAMMVTAGAAREEAQRRMEAVKERLREDERARQYRVALDQLSHFQTRDFREILRAMDGKPVVIRLLDAPLHEFLPPHDSLLEEVTALRITGRDPQALEEKERLLEVSRALREANPMLGHRGCRLGLTYPDIYEMQVRCIIGATRELRGQGLDPHSEIMIPMVMDVSELRALKANLERLVQELEKDSANAAPIHFGTMIELPRAALTAGDLAPEVEFFSFGSNDLTQMTFGFSRDDAEEKFLRFYVEKGLLRTNPFKTIDEKGMGRLIEMAVKEGRGSNPRLEIGLCGEHGGDPQSVDFCHRAGLDYVSCSPMRIPISRLAAAQAALEAGERDV